MLIHDLTANHRSWATFAPVLAHQGWFVIAPDLRGRGLSAKPAHGYGIPYHGNDLLALCDQLNLPKINLVGHSLGGLISLFFAAVHPQRTAKLVLVDAGGKVPDDAVQAIGVALSRLGQIYPNLDAYLDVFRLSSVVEWNPFWENHYRYDAETLADGRVSSRVPKAAIAEELAVNGVTRTDILPNFIKSPTLIARATRGLLGPDKGLILPEEEAERLQGIIPGCVVINIPDSNHYTLILSEVFEREVTKFLQAAS